MKKTMLILCAALLCALLSVSVLAAETVIYENDFSDPSTIRDFEQYRMTWEIRDGALYLTENMDPAVPNQKLNSTFSHIVYQADEPLTDYIVEVDYMNVQTAGGVLFNVQQDKADNQMSGFYGYTAFVSNDATKGALGSDGTNGVYKDNVNVGPGNKMNVGTNVHIKVTVKNEIIHVLFTNKDSGATIYDYTYAIGSNLSKDAVWKSGTVGLRMRGGYEANFVTSPGIAYFDNFKVTTANEATLEKPAAPVVVVKKPSVTIDTSSLTEVYRNTFDNADSIDDFSQFRGTWVVNDGKLYLSAATGGQSYIVYEGKKELTELTDYVIDVDINNNQTQGGVIIRSDIANMTGETDDGVMGYMGYLSFDGTKAALGAGKPDGKWLEGNIEVSPAVLQPGMNLHMQLAVKGNLLQVIVTEQGTGKVLWHWAEAHNLWMTPGSFGFRLYAKENGGRSNLNTMSFDNLVVSTFAEKTEVKLQIGNKTGYVNGEAKALDAAPIIRNSRTMLPVRFVAESLGATVGWDGATSTVTVTTATTKLEIKIGATTAKVNGVEVTLDSPTFIESSRTYLPVRFVAENLGAEVAWDGATSTATLTK